jgi:hypothetical protein
VQRPLHLDPAYVRRIEDGRYYLFDVECPTEIMAAYESLYATVYRRQENGDRLLAWVVTTSLVQGNIDFGNRLMDAMERLGWQRPTA